VKTTIGVIMEQKPILTNNKPAILNGKEIKQIPLPADFDYEHHLKVIEKIKREGVKPTSKEDFERLIAELKAKRKNPE
jgi:hypothetical protein